MYAEDFFNWLGEKIGQAIRFVIDLFSALFSGVFGNLFGAMNGFIDGLTRTLGINPSFFSVAILILGLWMLYNAVRAFMRRAVIGGLFWLLLGLLILSWIIH